MGGGGHGKTTGRRAPFMNKFFHSRHSCMGTFFPISNLYSLAHSAMLTNCTIEFHNTIKIMKSICDYISIPIFLD